MKSILCTGALGFIGSNFVNFFEKKYNKVKIIILDINDYCSSFDNIDNKNIKIIIGDIGNTQLVSYILKKYQIDTIINFASYSHVDNSFYNSIEFTKNNILNTHFFLETCRVYQQETNQLKLFLHISSDEVFGQSETSTPKTEGDRFNVSSPYASTKAAQECLCMSYYHSYKLPIIITRSSNIYGIQQYPEKLIPKFICHMIDGKKCPIQGDGSHKRLFLHVLDLCEALDIVIHKGIIGESYNISSDFSNEYTVMEVANMVVKLFDINNNVEDFIEFVEDRNFNDKRYYMSSEKLKTLGWFPKRINFEEELKEIIKWYKLKNK